MYVLKWAFSLLLLIPCGGLAAEKPAHPANFRYMGAGDLEQFREVLTRPEIAGVQIVYSWRSLEPGKDAYDFSGIERDLASSAVRAAGCGSKTNLHDQQRRDCR